MSGTDSIAVDAICPAGYQVTGGGYSTAPGISVPVDAPAGATRWHVVFKGNGDLRSDGTRAAMVTTYGVCVSQPEQRRSKRHH